MVDAALQVVHRLANRIILVEREEVAALLWAFAYFFCVLASYYILRPVRDEMGVLSGVQKLPGMFFTVFIAMVLVIPLFGYVAGHLTIRRLLGSIYGFFILNLLGFFIALQTGTALKAIAPVFFVWLSVFNLFVVSLFWSFMADVFSTDAARRLFGCIAAGGSLGAISGPALAAAVVKEVGVAGLLMASSVLLAGAAGCMVGLLRWYWRRHGKDLGVQHLSSSKNADASPPGLLVGISRIARSPYLAGISVYLICYSVLSTFLYSQQTILIPQVIPVSEDRTQLFATVDFGINVLAGILQLLATGTLLTRLGVVVMLVVMPVISIVGFGLFGLMTVLPVLIGFGVLRRAGEFSITKPTRETLFTVVPREEKYQAKNVIDTVIHRGGDVTGTWMVSVLQTWGLSLSQIAFSAIPVAIGWLVTGLWVGRRHETIRQGPTCVK